MDVVVTAVDFPTNPEVGDRFQNPETGVWYEWDGVAWNVIESSDDSGGGDVDLSGDVEIGTDCKNTLTVHSTAKFECDLDVDGELTVGGKPIADGGADARGRDYSVVTVTIGEQFAWTSGDKPRADERGRAGWFFEVRNKGEHAYWTLWSQDPAASNLVTLGDLESVGVLLRNSGEKNPYISVFTWPEGNEQDGGRTYRSKINYVNRDNLKREPALCALVSNPDSNLYSNVKRYQFVKDNGYSVGPQADDEVIARIVLATPTNYERGDVAMLVDKLFIEGKKSVHTVVLSANKDSDGIDDVPVDDVLYGRRNKDWVPVPPSTGGGDVHMAPCGDEPQGVDEGSLWYQTDALNLKIKHSDTWVPVVNRLDSQDYLRQEGGNLTGSLTVEDQATQGIDGDNSAVVFEVKSIAEDNEGGGAIITQDGNFEAVGNTQLPQSEHSFVTKKYLDETVEETISMGKDAKSEFIYRKSGTFQDMKGGIQPFNEGNAMATLVEGHRHVSPQFRLGNRHGVDKFGNEYGNDNFLSDAFNIELQKKNEYKPSGNYRSQWEYDDQRVNFRIKDRIALREDMQTNVREGSRARGELEPPATTDGKKFTVLRDIKWSEDEVWAGGSAGAPKQFFLWVASPDDEEYNAISTGSTYLAPYETRVANVQWVEQQIADNAVGKGSDLCADSEQAAEPGGFWRDSNGRVYLRTV